MEGVDGTSPSGVVTVSCGHDFSTKQVSPAQCWASECWLLERDLLVRLRLLPLPHDEGESSASPNEGVTDSSAVKKHSWLDAPTPGAAHPHQSRHSRHPCDPSHPSHPSHPIQLCFWMSVEPLRLPLVLQGCKYDVVAPEPESCPWP